MTPVGVDVDLVAREHSGEARGDGRKRRARFDVTRFGGRARQLLEEGLDERGERRSPRFRVRLRALDDFPIRDGKGRFLVSVQVADAALDYAPGWPGIEGIDGEVRFEGPGLRIVAPRGRIFGVELVDVLAKNGEQFVVGSDGTLDVTLPPMSAVILVPVAEAD